MTLPRDSFIDLQTVASADGIATNLANAAVLLMSRDMTSRLPRDYRRYTGHSDVSSKLQTHFAWRDYTDYPSASDLDALLYENPGELTLRPRIRCGQTARRARYYLHYRTGSFSASVPYHGSHSPTPVDASLASMSEDLRDLAIGEIGSPAFEAARQPFVDYFEIIDFAARRDVAFYRVLGTAAPGAPFHLETRNIPVPGFSRLSKGDSPEITVPASGTYKIRFYEIVRSASTANPTTIAVSFRVNGVEVASRSLSRNSADPNEFVRFSPVDVEIEIDGVLTVRNGSASTETAAGVLLVWSDE